MNKKRLALLLGSTACAVAIAASCGDDSGAVDAGSIDAAPPLGTVSLSWSLSDGTSAIDCSDVGALTVSIQVLPRNGLNGSVDPFSCTVGSATTRGLAPGLYDIEIDVRASGSRSLLAAPVKLPGIEVKANQDTPLSAQEFVIDPVGSFSFFLDGGAGAGNCETVANGGAGIVGVSFALEDGDGVCKETDFVIAAGSQAGATFSSSCSTPATPVPCFGSDQLVTVSNVPSGSWSMTSTAQKAGPIDCYSRISEFPLAGNNLLTELGSLELALKFSVDCDPNFVPPDAGPPDASP